MKLRSLLISIFYFVVVNEVFSQKIQTILYLSRGSVEFKQNGKWIPASNEMALDDTTWVRLAQRTGEYLLRKGSNCALIGRPGINQVRMLDFLKCDASTPFRRLIEGLRPSNEYKHNVAPATSMPVTVLPNVENQRNTYDLLKLLDSSRSEIDFPTYVTYQASIYLRSGMTENARLAYLDALGSQPKNKRIRDSYRSFKRQFPEPQFSQPDPTVMVIGTKSDHQYNIIENAANSRNHTTLVAAVKAANLVGDLSANDEYTLFAPDNTAFGSLPAGTIDNLIKPENKNTLTSILRYHMVKGKWSTKKLKKAIHKARGQFQLKTVLGQYLTFSLKGNKIVVKDRFGRTSEIKIADVPASNGLIHSIDQVLLPELKMF